MRLVKLMLIALISFSVVFSSTAKVYADPSSDLILKLLVKKGVISQKEVDELKAEIKKAEVDVPAGDIAAHVKKTGWAEKIKLKGDIRLRNEYQKPGAGRYINRQRIRARAGIKAKITDTVQAGIGLATGGNGVGTARSTNQTLSQAFSTKPFDLDLAYVSWKPYKFLKVIGGKYKNPLYHPADLLWDGDLRFEGASANVKYSLDADFDVETDLYAKAGVFVLDDLGVDAKSPLLYVVQAGLGSSYEDYVDWKLIGGYLDFSRIQNTTSTALVPTTGDANAVGQYAHDYNVVEVGGEATFHFLEREASDPFAKALTLFGDYIYNITGVDKQNGWQVGFKLGKKPKALGEWRAVYNFRALERNSFPDDFPDADSFRGRTDGFGHEAIFSYGLAKNLWLELDYYIFRDKTRGVDPNDKWGQIFQIDLNTKF